MSKRINRLEDWLTAGDASQQLSEKMGFRVPPQYIRSLAKSKRQPVRVQSLGYHQLYHKDDILACKVKQKIKREGE